MRNVLATIWHYVRVAYYWWTGEGPWFVVGQYVDDYGTLQRYATWQPEIAYRTLGNAMRYAEKRNEDALTDPLDTVFYVWHEIEWNRYLRKQEQQRHEGETA